MRALDECFSCLKDLAYNTAKLSSNNAQERDVFFQKSLAYLNNNFSGNSIPTVLAGEMQRIIRQEANCKDPFADIKSKEMEAAGNLYKEFNTALTPNLDDLIKFAVKGNSIDFFVDIETLRKDVKQPVKFSRNDVSQLEKKLQDFSSQAKDNYILYLADNAGECYFDLPLITKLQSYFKVYYVVKSGPVQNDLTLNDLKNSGINQHFNNVIESGSDTPGLDINLASKEFMRLFYNSGLIIAKGMGHYETLPEIDLPAPTFLLMKAKCNPVASSLKVNLNSHIAARLH